MTQPDTTPNTDELQEALENLYDAQDSIKGTGTDPVRSRSAQIRKAREFIQAHTQLAVREATPRWWICTDFFRNNGEKVIGPFSTKELALDVRRLYEMLSDKTYAVDELQEDK